MGHCILDGNYRLSLTFMEIHISYSAVAPSPCLADPSAFYDRLLLKHKFEKAILNPTYLGKFYF